MAGLMDFFGQLQNPEQADIRRIDNALGMPQSMPPQGAIGGAPWPVSSAADVAMPAQQAAPEGFFGGMKSYFQDPERMARLAIGLNSMRMRPDAGIAESAAQDIKYLREKKAAEQTKNKTIEAMQQMGMDQAELNLLAENPELLKVAATAMYKKRYGGDITADIQNWNMLTKGLSPDDEAKARRIKLGLEARAGLPNDVYFGRGYSTAAGTEAGKFEADVVKQAEAFRILRGQLEFGFDNLGAALGATGQTGKIFGNLPAVTTSAQLADQAKAILLPVMKGVWRSAGEGVFTDKDQETLERMFPTRDMTPEAAKQALMVVRQLTELKLQNPKFDINSFGSALQYRGAPSPAAMTTTQTQAQPAAQSMAQTPAQQDESKLLNKGNVMKIGGNLIVEVGK